MKVEREPFGQTKDGVSVEKYRLSNSGGLSVDLITYGALIQSVKAPDRDGRRGEISLGFDELSGYLGEHPYFGATVGRYANRIRDGRFELDGRSVELARNNGPNHLHGGDVGFDKHVWAAESFQEAGKAGVRFERVSPDGEEGYPGELSVVVTFTLDEQACLAIDYVAETDRLTAVNLTNHAYWNLRGAGSGDVGAHVLTIAADRWLPVDATQIPTGELASVEGTPMDFREPVAIGARIDATDGGYDHCYVLGEPATEPRFAARLKDPDSGRCLEVWTTEPGIQLYTGNFLDGIRGAGGRVFEPRGAVCLEAQRFPDSVHQPEFPSALLRPGERYTQRTEHRFSVD